MVESFRTYRGFPYPFGVTKTTQGTNFAIFSRHAIDLSLCLFKKGEQLPHTEIPLDREKNKTGHMWHMMIDPLPPDSHHYGYRVAGPFEPLLGHSFDNRLVLLDPYARQVASPHEWGISSRRDTAPIHSGVIDPDEPFDWEGDMHPNIAAHELVIYEMHVRGFTQDPSSGVPHRGTFLGIVEKIPYLKTLGVNAVELMPIHEFNEMANSLTNPSTGEALNNYWGYSTMNFFSPMNRYGTKNGNTLTEFKTMVKALHAAGIEVFLDVVYNHTGEGGQNGPIFSFKGLENSVYYMLGPKGEYYDFSGCGNTVNCNSPVVRSMIRDSLRYWVTEMHIDGFRFDLASVLVRSREGVPLANPPLVEELTLDPILAQTQLIAEAWDAAGLYQVGSFPGQGAWAEWNGKYRDDVRRFIKGTDGAVGNFATRITGSEDLYGDSQLCSNSINFVTAHDGFTLADLVSYNEKHNEMNGEGNRDGDNNNLSWNCGVEGETQDPALLALRERQRKNFHVALMTSQGVPMILMGDEYGHTKLGNNNTWAHDSRLNWFQWDTWEQNAPFFRFYTMMIAFRRNHPVLTRASFLSKEEITWHGQQPSKADWSSKNRFLAYTLSDPLNHYSLYIAFNASAEEISIQLPPPQHRWRRFVYTFLPSPEDILETPPEISTETFTLAPYSSLILKDHI